MTVKVKYRVHSAVRQQVDVVAMICDREVPAQVPGLVVELVRANGAGEWGHTFKFVPESDPDFAAALDLFRLGAKIDVTFTPHVADKA